MNSSPTPDPSSHDEMTSTQSFPAPVIQELPAQSRSRIPAEITQTISRVKPDIALDYVDKWVNLEYQDRDKERSHQLQLAQAKLDLEKKKEANKASERAADRNFVQSSIRWGLGIFFVVFLSSLGFAYAVRDEEGKIPLTVLSIAAGVLGGTSIAGLKNKNNNTDKHS